MLSWFLRFGKTHVWRLLVCDMSWMSNVEKNTTEIMIIIISCTNTVAAAAAAAGYLRNVHLHYQCILYDRYRQRMDELLDEDDFHRTEKRLRLAEVPQHGVS